MGVEQLHLILECLPFLVTHIVSDGPEEVVSVEPISDRAPHIASVELVAESIVSLDRFAYLRRRPEVHGLCLESPLALHRAQLGQAMASLIGRITVAPTAISEIGDERERAALRLLVAAGLIHCGGCTQAEDERLATWSFHDLLFHARSRPGRSDGVFGVAFSHLGRSSALPAVPPKRTLPVPVPVIELPRPTFANIVASERSFTEVLESRRSVRKYGEPLTLEQIGEFLYRSARIRRIHTSRSPGSYDLAEHPYPTGGLAAELELYLCIVQCTGLASGIYHYESAAHRLRFINESEAAELLVESARKVSGGSIEPQVLVTITSRFARTAWKYDSIAYALTLKHVGVLMQTLYLVATSMGLAPCALGSGDADQAARAFGLDWLLESSVGEFALGSRAEPTTWADRFADIVSEHRTDPTKCMPGSGGLWTRVAESKSPGMMSTSATPAAGGSAPPIASMTSWGTAKSLEAMDSFGRTQRMA
jgi:SagB-type dehydrogenase family enzyme